MNRIFIVLILFTLPSCTYEKGSITKELKTNLVSFNYVLAEKYPTIKNNFIKSIKNNILTISYYTEEFGCPAFEGGCLVKNDTLFLYYQDINFQLVKCIDLFELTYVIDQSNINYSNIKILQFPAIKKGLHF